MIGRCGARHPSHTAVRCEERSGHAGEHFHSFYMRSWESEPERTAVRVIERPEGWYLQDANGWDDAFLPRGDAR